MRRWRFQSSPVAQHRGDQVVVGHDDHLAAAELQPVQGPEGLAPLLELQVHARGVDLQQVAEERHPARAGQVVEPAQRRWRSGRRGRVLHGIRRGARRRVDAGDADIA